MPKARFIQTIASLPVLALFAGCASSHEYLTKLFGPRPENMPKDTQLVVRFLEMDSLDAGRNWVTTNITKDSSVLKDSSVATNNLPKETKVIPGDEQPVTKNIVSSNKPVQPMPIIPDAQGGRTKRTRENDRSQK